ncbi:MAG TPA: hypothetical protein VMR37_03385, partial [Rhabdochlamydiaceae bacterium]|nr:hypothetical protein [Rhabdochlamydiaceae bacterium]
MVPTSAGGDLIGPKKRDPVPWAVSQIQAAVEPRLCGIWKSEVVGDVRTGDDIRVRAAVRRTKWLFEPGDELEGKVGYRVKEG